jgi:ElaB/YqjD/DUF883 family membrane-anchored ribosome-binding protein
MFGSNDQTDELQTLKSAASRLLNTTRDEFLTVSGNSAEALADQIKTVLNELGETVSEQQNHAGRMISDRPVATLASAFALGVVVGFMLRRH